MWTPIQRSPYGLAMTRQTTALASLMREIMTLIERNASNLEKMNRRWTRERRPTRENLANLHPQSRHDPPWQDNSLDSNLDRTPESTIKFRQITRTCRELPTTCSSRCVSNSNHNRVSNRRILHLARRNKHSVVEVWRALEPILMAGTDQRTKTTFLAKWDHQQEQQQLLQQLARLSPCIQPLQAPWAMKTLSKPLRRRFKPFVTSLPRSKKRRKSALSRKNLKLSKWLMPLSQLSSKRMEMAATLAQLTCHHHHRSSSSQWISH